jgi:hypothetical protein
MSRHRRVSMRMLPVAIVMVIVGHVVVPYVLTHTAVSATLVSGVLVLIVLKHLGVLAMVLGPVYARFRRRSPH